MKPLSKLIAALFAGTAVLTSLSAPAQQLPLNTAARPQRNVTSFDDGLRCMDQMLLRFGTRDVTVMLEDIPDKTGRSVDDARAALAKDNADGRLIAPEHVAAKVLWLCSPAAGSVNGEAIVIGGAA